MSLRGKLFGAVSVTLFVVMLVLVSNAYVLEHARQDTIEQYQNLALRLAAEHAYRNPPGGIPDPSLPGDEEGLPDGIQSFVVFEFERNTDMGQPQIKLRLGAPSPRRVGPTEPVELCRDALREKQTVREGTSIAVPLKVLGLDSPRRVAYLEVTPSGIGADRVAQNTFIVVVVSAFVLLACVWVIVSRYVTRPLRNVAEAARRVGEGDYSEPVPSPAGDDEIQRVIAAFNQMMEEVSALQWRLQEDIGDAVSQERKAQASLVIAQRLGATGQLAAGIAHEVNNPLGGMLNAVEALQHKQMSDDRRRAYLELIDDGLKRIQATVSKILQFTPHKVAPQEVDLKDVVRPTIELARHRIERDGVQVTIEPAEGAVVFGDPYELQQALLNVVLNALDALGDADRESPSVLIRTTVDEQDVQLLVRDNGTGMSKKDMDRAFDLFFTTKETGKGSGLGLATAHKIVSDHGGRLELESRGDDGLDVLFVLPRATS